MSVTAEELDNRLYKSILSALRETKALIERKEAERKPPNPNERVGFFTTNLRRHLIQLSDGSRDMYNACKGICDTDSWDDVGVPYKGSGYNGIRSYSVFNRDVRISVDDHTQLVSGVWRLSHEKMVSICDRAMMEVSWKPGHLVIDGELKLGLKSLEFDLACMQNIIDRMNQINAASDTVMGALEKVANELVA